MNEFSTLKSVKPGNFGKLADGAHPTENQLGIEFNSPGARIESKRIYDLPWEKGGRAVTIDLWMKPFEVLAGSHYFIFGGNDHKNLELGLDSTHLQIRYGDTVLGTSKFFFIPYVWVYIVVTFDQHFLRIYINNYMDTETAIQLPTKTEYIQGLTIGSRLHFVNYFKSEYIDDFKGVLAGMHVALKEVDIGEVISNYNEARY
jgi:hypothetical protein